MTTGQLLAAACAVLSDTALPSLDEPPSEVVKRRLEAANGAPAADAFFKATQEPDAILTRAVYPLVKDAKTPKVVYRKWCSLRGGDDPVVQQGEQCNHS